ncbi:MAG: hypothetical protein Q7S56_01300 [Nanoarchaeota archaeon]|nr:hypothetical protein [Nanoarchaeota archaeon]
MKADQKFDKFILRHFNNWELYLHEAQFPYLGRTYAWAKREDADLITQMTSEETSELFTSVIPLWDSAMQEFLGENYSRPNVAILGNTTPHLHAHLIPRLTKPINKFGIEFIDPNPKGNYAPYEKRKLSEELLMEIKDTLILGLTSQDLLRNL